MFSCLPDLYIKYITAFFNFLQLCVPQKTKKMPLAVVSSSARLVSSRLRLFRALWLRLFPFFIIFQIPICVFFLQRGYEFLLSSEPQIGFNMKKKNKRRNPSTNFVALCVCVCVCTPNLVCFFLVAAAFMIIEPSHTHTHHQHLSLSQNSRCISESHLKFGFFIRFSFSVFFSFLREPIMRFVFRISNIFHSSLWFHFGEEQLMGRRAWHREQGAEKRGRGQTNLLFFHCN